MASWMMAVTSSSSSSGAAVSSTMTTKTTTPTTPTKTGMLMVGLGGNNGVTLVAGHVANRRGLSWETANCGRVSAPNWNGCITQLKAKGSGSSGFQGLYPLADATKCVLGGWDIRSTPLGDALYASRVLDYDLVRQVREEMNSMPIWKGIYNASFVGESQHATATHTTTTTSSYVEQVEHVRKDIRQFIQDNAIDGHTTVIWTASVERPADIQLERLEDLVQALQDPKADISPSIIYATAAALEGCSFVNGGSQNTLSKGLYQLYQVSNRCTTTTTTSTISNIFQEVSTQPAYLLGTDFKAGQTKFKTAAVEYIRALGLSPQVIASSNHLGNNDMLNLTSKKTISAKLRVKSNIFEPWKEDQLDHQVRVMYTPFMLDEKRDIVEYTSLGFLHCPHTMLTYTRCMDSILCVPLMVDVTIWCDFFARHDSPMDLVARATSYLFKIPEGGASGVDPGFSNQMQELRKALDMTVDNVKDDDAATTTNDLTTILAKGVAAGILTVEQVEQLKQLV